MRKLRKKDLNQDILKRLCSYIELRSLHTPREFTIPPATGYHNPISAALDEYHLCNVWRDLDFTTRYEYHRVKNMSRKSRLRFTLLLWHTFNVPLAELLFAGWSNTSDVDSWSYNLPVANPAVIFFPAKGHTHASWAARHAEHVDIALDLLDRNLKDSRTPYEFMNVVTSLRTLGEFRAYEVLTSLSYHGDYNFPIHQPLLVGPGAIRGLSDLVGLTHTLTQKEALSYLPQATELVRAELVRRDKMAWIKPRYQLGPHRQIHSFNFRTLEDCLCEYRKYRAAAGVTKGRRRRHRPTSERVETWTRVLKSMSAHGVARIVRRVSNVVLRERAS